MFGKGFSIASFDTLIKAKGDHVHKRTLCGALISLTAATVIVMLALSEVMVFLGRDVDTHMVVDEQVGDQQLEIMFDISYYHLPCKELELEVQNSKGELYNDDQARVSLRKSPIRDPGAKQVVEAATGDGKKMSDIGCRVGGSVRVNRVAGNMHVVPLPFSARGPRMGRMQASLGDLLVYNASHTIHMLSFGPRYPGKFNPLDAVTSINDKRPVQFQYHVKVVPTTYRTALGGTIESYSYSVSDHQVNADPLSPFFVPPGMIVQFDFSPLKVEQVEGRGALPRLLTSLIAIVGGVFTVARMADMLLHRSWEMLKKLD